MCRLLVIGHLVKIMELKELNVYKISRDISKVVWAVYEKMARENKILIGQQLVRSSDSIGANIAEGYGRFHYLDSAKFYYNARGSLFESKHWIDLLFERNMLEKELHEELSKNFDVLGKKLNGFINSIKEKAGDKKV